MITQEELNKGVAVAILTAILTVALSWIVWRTAPPIDLPEPIVPPAQQLPA